MKKILLSLISIFVLSVGVFAQEDVTTVTTTNENNDSHTAIVNKKGEPILPKAGDIAIGMDMVPFMNYLGNFGNSTTNNEYDSNGFLEAEHTVLLKYFLQDDAALRIRFCFENQNLKRNQYVQDDAAVYANPLNANAKTTDQMMTKMSDFKLGLGYEMHRNKGRLVGIYGAEAFVTKLKTNYTYTYGNPFSEINPNPTFYDFNANSPTNGSRRITYAEGNGGFGFGADLFLGVEYFFMPNICIGSELTWGAVYQKGSQSYREEEYWNGSSVQDQKILVSPGNKGFGLGMDNPSISVYFMFHF